jgi:uncharacterized protein YbaP (TraB family)
MFEKVMQWLSALLFFSLVSVSLVSAPLASADPQINSEKNKSHLIWKGSIAQSTVYLMGSIHFGLPSMYPLPKRIVAAFERADVLMVEVDIRKTNQAATMALVGEMGFYHDGSTLQDHLSVSQYQRFGNAMQQFGLSIEAMLPQKPWLAVLTLSAAAVKAQGFSEQFGVDQYFLNRASNKQVIEIESIAQQITLMDGFGVQEQQWMLNQSLDELDRADIELRAMVLNWQTGNETAFIEQTLKEFPEGEISQRVYKAVFVDRNINMTRVIEKAATTTRGSYFVVVGAGHLIGTEGVPALLQKKGYRISRY